MRKIYFFAVFGCVLWLHTFQLSLVPGFHFDEAWAAWFSHRIAFEPGFWPLTAMSPYTSPWTHYATALVFKVFGPSVLTYRLSYLFWSLLALILFSAFFIRIEKSYRSGTAFLILAGTSVAVFANHRFAVELNSFLPFCAGLFFASLSFLREKPRLAQAGLIVSLILGTTSHILFLAFPLTVVLTILFTQEKISLLQKRIFAVLGFCFLLFFFRTLVGNSWKLKSIALILATAVFLFWLFQGAPLFRLFKRARPVLMKVFALLFCIFAFNFLVFFEGHWGILFHKGFLNVHFGVGASLILSAGLLYFGFRRKIFAAREQLFFFFLLISLGLLMITPAPRYFHIAFLVLCMGLARILSLLPLWLARLFMLCWAGVGVGSLSISYFNPHFKDRDFRFLTLKDSSNDLIPKSELGAFLERHQCSFADIQSTDPRTALVFSTLALFEPRSEQNHCALRGPLIWKRKKDFAAATSEQILWSDESSFLSTPRL